MRAEAKLSQDSIYNHGNCLSFGLNAGATLNYLPQA